MSSLCFVRDKANEHEHEILIIEYIYSHQYRKKCESNNRH